MGDWKQGHTFHDVLHTGWVRKYLERVLRRASLFHAGICRHPAGRTELVERRIFSVAEHAALLALPEYVKLSAVICCSSGGSEWWCCCRGALRNEVSRGVLGRRMVAEICGCGAPNSDGSKPVRPFTCELLAPAGHNPAHGEIIMPKSNQRRHKPHYFCPRACALDLQPRFACLASQLPVRSSAISETLRPRASPTVRPDDDDCRPGAWETADG